MTRASFRQFKNSSKTIADGYAQVSLLMDPEHPVARLTIFLQFSRKGRPFFVPDMSFKAQVLLPQEHIKWLTTQPESILSVYKVRDERHAFKYLSNSIEHNVTIKFLDNIVGRCLTKSLHRIQADMHDEIRASVDDTMGLDDEWHEVNLQQTMKTVADRTGSRALFGLPLCRDQTFLRNMDRFIVLMGLGMVVVGQTPWFIRPFIGAMVNLPLRIYKARILRILVPLVKARMQEYELRKHSGSLKDESNDFATQAVKVTMERKDRSVFDDPDILAEQFLLLVSFGCDSREIITDCS